MLIIEVGRCPIEAPVYAIDHKIENKLQKSFDPVDHLA
jgi:hypothetical protein